MSSSCRTQPRRAKPAYSERVLHHLLHAALVVVREVSCRAADTGVLTKVEDAALARGVARVMQRRVFRAKLCKSCTFKQFNVVLSSVNNADETEALARGRSNTCVLPVTCRC